MMETTPPCPSWGNRLAAFTTPDLLARQAQVLVASFHPELTSDRRVHAMFLDMVHTSAATAA